MTGDEEQLLERARGGDRAAFGALYDHYVGRIYRFIFLKVSNRADAEDLTSTVFSSAWENMQRFELRGFPFSSWLYRIAGNAVIDHYRTTRRHDDLETVPEESLAEHPGWGETLDRESDLRHVRLAITKLTPEHQTVLIMRFVDDRSTREISHTLSKSEGAVRVIQHRALRELKRHLDLHDTHRTTHTV